VEPAASKPYFFANPDRPGYAEQTNFRMPKPAGTVRIFLVGESAAKGYPQPRNLSMSAFLQEMLQAAWPGRTVETINLGTTAVASFPLVYQVRDALRFDPDLFIFYLGNNEFFGAYGTGSLSAAGRLPPRALRILRGLRGSALFQTLNEALRRKSDGSRTLMEEMMGRAAIPAESPLRAAAARNLEENLIAMLAHTRAAGVPAIVCTTASNEADLAPLGADDEAGADPAQRAEALRLLAEGEARLADQPAAAANAFRRAAACAPRNARARFGLGRALAAAGDRDGAREAFLAARDLDTLPWRPTSQTEAAIRSAARRMGVPLADVAERFRQASPLGATGHESAGDHVHLTLHGQALAARCMAETMSSLTGPLQLSAGALARLPDSEDLARRLGANPYDEYRVNHTLRVLFGVDFMRRSNPDALERFERACRLAESDMSPAVLEAARQWQTMRPHAGGLRPSPDGGPGLLREGRVDEAAASSPSPPGRFPTTPRGISNTSILRWPAAKKSPGALRRRIWKPPPAPSPKASFLLTRGFSQKGLTERYVGRLHQLRGEWVEAIPQLLAARPRMTAGDLLACDQALVMSYVKTDRIPEARSLIHDGIRRNGRFAGVYRQLLAQLPPPAALLRDSD
jgi:tetratricopeptide (TPR) repeat protein